MKSKRRIWKKGGDDEYIRCPNCRKERLLMISSEFVKHSWQANYYECQWCGEEFVMYGDLALVKL